MISSTNNFKLYRAAMAQFPCTPMLLLEAFLDKSLVKPKFEGVIHLKELDMQQMPAPFLNQFDKFRLTISEVLQSGWIRLGGISTVFAKSRLSTSKLVSLLGKGTLLGWMNDSQTLDSVFVNMLPATLSGAHGKAMPSLEVGSDFEEGISFRASVRCDR